MVAHFLVMSRKVLVQCLDGDALVGWEDGVAG